MSETAYRARKLNQTAEVQPKRLYDILIACHKCGEEQEVYCSAAGKALKAIISRFELHLEHCSGSLGVPCTECGLHQSPEHLVEHQPSCDGTFLCKDGREWDLHEMSAQSIHPLAVRYMRNRDLTKFVCDWEDDDGNQSCTRAFSSESALDTHIEYIHEEKGRCLECPGYVCLSSSDSLLGHWRRFHSDLPSKLKACKWEGCEDMVSPDAMKKHMLAHTNLVYRAPYGGCFYLGAKFVVRGESTNTKNNRLIVEEYLGRKADSKGVSLSADGGSDWDETIGVYEWNRQKIRSIQHYYLSVDPDFLKPDAPRDIGVLCRGPLGTPELCACPHGAHINLHTTPLDSRSSIIGEGEQVGRVLFLSLDPHCLLCRLSPIMDELPLRALSKDPQCEAKECSSQKFRSTLRYCVKHLKDCLRNKKIQTNRNYGHRLAQRKIHIPKKWSTSSSLAHHFQHKVKKLQAIDFDKIFHVSEMLQAMENETRQTPANPEDLQLAEERDVIQPAGVAFTDTEFDIVGHQKFKLTEVALGTSRHDILLHCFAVYPGESTPRSTNHAKGLVTKIPPYVAAEKVPLMILNALRPTDILAEWSKNDCDFKSITQLLQRYEPSAGYELPESWSIGNIYDPPENWKLPASFNIETPSANDEDLRKRIYRRKFWPDPSRRHSVYLFAVAVFRRIKVELPNMQLQTVFHAMFPRHKFALFHHLATVDMEKTILVAMVLFQLFKPPGQRQFPPGFGEDSEYFVLSHFDPHFAASLLEFDPTTGKTSQGKNTTTGKDRSRDPALPPAAKRQKRNPTDDEDPIGDDEKLAGTREMTDEELYPDGPDIMDLEEEARDVPRHHTMRPAGGEDDEEYWNPGYDNRFQGRYSLSFEQGTNLQMPSYTAEQKDRKRKAFVIHCEHCNIAFETLTHLDKHTNRWDGSCSFNLLNRSYTCSHCEDSYTTEEYKNKHKRDVCRKRPAPDAEDEDEEWDDREYKDDEDIILEELVKEHRGVEFAFCLAGDHEMAKCLHPDCDATTTNLQTGMQQHILWCHPEEVPFKCEEPGCDRAYATQGQLNLHQMQRHSSNRFDCKHDGCTKTFTRKDNFERHMQTHDEEGTYQCEHCPAKRRTRDAIREHYRVHSNKRYYCTEPGCTCSYKAPHDLGKHLRRKHRKSGT